MSATPGRITCPRCGESNFDTQAACWKCAAPLRGGAPPRPATGQAPASAAPAPSPTAPPVYAAPAPTVDPSVAVWAAIALALLFPYVAVPVGIVFLMLDDRRKAEIGRITLLWGVVATILHTLFTFMLMRQTMMQAAMLMQSFGRGLPGAGSASAGASDDPNAIVPGLRMPGEVTLPEGGGGVTFPEVPSGVRRLE